MTNEKSDEKDPVKKRKSRIETEQKILDAALSVFSELGYEAASIQTIAARANVNGALIIRYFGSKSALLQAIMVGGCEGNFSEYSCNPPAESLEDEIARFFMCEIKTDYEHYEFLRLVLQRAIVDPEVENVLATILAKDGRKELIACLKIFQDRGEIPADMNLTELSHIFLTHALGFGTNVQVIPNSDRGKIEERARMSAKIFADGLKSAAKSHSKP